MKIIAITAEKETGKTTSVEYMKKKLIDRGVPVAQINFKDALIEELIEKFPDLLRAIGETYDNDRMWYDGNSWTIERLFKEKPPLIRRLMQNYGTNVKRKENPLYWVHKWFYKVAPLDGTNVVVFVDDARFLNEVEAVRSFENHLILRLEGVGFPHTGLDTHLSETEMKQIVPDLTIQSIYGDLPGLYAKLDPVCG